MLATLMLVVWGIGLSVSSLSARHTKKYYTPFYYFNLVFAFATAILGVVTGMIHFYPPVISFTDEFTLGHLFIASFNTAFLAHLFTGLNKQFDFGWIRHFFYIGILLTLVATSTIHIDTMPFLAAVMVILIFECIGTGFVWLLAKIIQKTQSKKLSSQFFVRPEQSKAQHYAQAGLSPREIELLRAQLAVAKQQILTIEQLMNQNAKLRSIELRHNTVKISQAFFKEIVQSPTKFMQASTFLYKLLSSLEDLLNKYIEVNGHVAKNKQTYLILEKSASTIEQLCAKISEEYIRFHQDDFNDLSDEISLAQRNMAMNFEEDVIDDLLKGEF